MAKILVLAESGFGKSTSLLPNTEFGIKGLDPDSTYIISVTSKPLPARGSNKMYPVCPNFTKSSTAMDLKDYRRVITNDPETVAHAITLLSNTNAIKTVVLDDSNYLMQDYYMAKALSTGWDTPKRIGFDMGKVFSAMEKLVDKNFVMLAHGEEYDKVDGRKGYRMKTTGKMVQEYITPEGKFDIVLIGKSHFDDASKKAVKQFITNDDGMYTTAKSAPGMFEQIYILNDMGLVIDKVNEYYD